MDDNNIRMREYIYSLLELKPHMALLDLGCGKGYDLQRISEMVDEQSKLYGIDASESSIEAAARENAADERFLFSAGDVSKRIPFPDHSFDAVFSINMLECITDKQQLLREVYRVLKPDGQVVFAHFDWDSQLIDGKDKALVRKVVQAFNDWKQDWMTDVDGWMGRRLWRTFQESGLFEGKIETYVLTNTKFEEPYYGHMIISGFEALVRKNIITKEELDQFMTNIYELSAKNQYFYSITMYIYAGHRPSG